MNMNKFIPKETLGELNTFSESLQETILGYTPDNEPMNQECIDMIHEVYKALEEELADEVDIEYYICVTGEFDCEVFKVDKLLEDLEDAGGGELTELFRNYGYTFDTCEVEGMINLIENSVETGAIWGYINENNGYFDEYDFQECYLGKYEDLEVYIKELLAPMFEGVDPMLEQYFDYDKYLKDAEQDGAYYTFPAPKMKEYIYKSA